MTTTNRINIEFFGFKNRKALEKQVDEIIREMKLESIAVKVWIKSDTGRCGDPSPAPYALVCGHYKEDIDVVAMVLNERLGITVKIVRISGFLPSAIEKIRRSAEL